MVAYNLETETLENLEDMLNAYRERSATSFKEVLDFGMTIVDNAAWFSDVTSIREALNALRSGGFQVEETGDHSATVCCENPYPSDFNYSLLYNIILKFRDETSSQVLVKLDKNATTRAGSYHLVW